MRKNRMMVVAAQCPKCLDIIYSRARHDFRPCRCVKQKDIIYVDGGFDYLRAVGEIKEKNIINYLVSATKEELFNDYNTNQNKYGSVNLPKNEFDMIVLYPVVYKKDTDKIDE